MKFEIGIPTLNRVDLLYPSLRMYATKDFQSHIHIIDNGNDQFKNKELPNNVSIINMENNIGVAASWNMLCNRIFKVADYALILNDDIYLGRNQLQIEALLPKDNKPFFLKATPDWCAFIISKSMYQEIGAFDEVFYPAYYEDKSYEYRMKLKGYKAMKNPLLNPFVYKSSQTLEKEPSIIDSARNNRKIYVDMWGGEPTKEKFTKPYNK